MMSFTSAEGTHGKAYLCTEERCVCTLQRGFDLRNHGAQRELKTAIPCQHVEDHSWRNSKIKRLLEAVVLALKDRDRSML